MTFTCLPARQGLATEKKILLLSFYCSFRNSIRGLLLYHSTHCMPFISDNVTDLA